MMIVLIHNSQTGQMQFSTEGGDPQLAIKLMQQAIAMVQQQTGTITPGIGPNGQPASPPPPRPRNIRQVILPASDRVQDGAQ